MGKLTISMAIFNSFLLVYQAGYTTINGSMWVPSPYPWPNPPAPKVLGRDLPDGTRKRLQVSRTGVFRTVFYSVFWRRASRPIKNRRFWPKNAPPQVERARPKSASEKWKNPVFFNFLTSIFWFATSFFAVPQVAGPGGGFLSFWTRFRTDFRRFVIAETLVFTVFFCFLHAWRLASKLPKTS